MKFLVLIAVVLLVLWAMRQGRRDEPRAGKPGRPAPPQEMVECASCGLHLPRTDALPGPDGQLYCCAEHRQNARG
jgi:uncharacterized protein